MLAHVRQQPMRMPDEDTADASACLLLSDRRAFRQSSARPSARRKRPMPRCRGIHAPHLHACAFHMHMPRCRHATPCFLYHEQTEGDVRVLETGKTHGVLGVRR